MEILKSIEEIVMYHNLEASENCQSLWKICHSLVPKLLDNCTVKSCDVKIISSKPIDPSSRSVYLVKSGIISEKYQDQLVVNHEDGDLIGLDGLLQQKSTQYENDFAVTVDEYDGDLLLEEIFNSKDKFLILNQYLSCLSQSYQLLMCHFSQQDVSFNPEYRHYNKGDIIIEQNTEGDEVFTLITGEAKVVVNDTEVGVIHKDEIFGAIAALTNTKRNASIIATSDCDTIIVQNDSFRDLLSARPDTIQKLINDMARTIVSCNEKIMTLSEDK